MFFFSVCKVDIWFGLPNLSDHYILLVDTLYISLVRINESKLIYEKCSDEQIDKFKDDICRYSVSNQINSLPIRYGSSFVQRILKKKLFVWLPQCFAQLVRSNEGRICAIKIKIFKYNEDERRNNRLENKNCEIKRSYRRSIKTHQ